MNEMNDVGAQIHWEQVSNGWVIIFFVQKYMYTAKSIASTYAAGETEARRMMSEFSDFLERQQPDKKAAGN